MQPTRFALLAVLLAAGTVLAQTSPEVHADHRVTFRLKAPDAKDARVRCESLKEAKMEKDDKGIWSWTSESLEPDIYTYSFQVDGARVIDPVNPLLKYNLLNT